MTPEAFIDEWTNRLIGGAGNDNLIGNSGVDTAVYDGLRSDYEVLAIAGGAFQVRDLRAGSPNGTDVVAASVEKLQFADQVVQLGTPGMNLVGTDNPETLTGGTGNDYIEGNGGNDTLNGLGGADGPADRPARLVAQAGTGATQGRCCLPGAPLLRQRPNGWRAWWWRAPTRRRRAGARPAGSPWR